MTDDTPDEAQFDIRTLERKLDQGQIDREEYEAHLEDLPDVSDNAEPIESEFEEGLFEDDETAEAQVSETSETSNDEE